MVIKVVIGANFGDEGKGLMTDYFCHQSTLRGEKTLVVLHNGGAQRGHTVVTPDGQRHVFQHFGSGTLVGADTYLSKDFILNPIVFRQEWEELESLCVYPTVYAHPLCRITTPYDMIANQIMEEKRGDNKHGSCGLGVFETIKRYEERDTSPIWKIKVFDVGSLMMKDCKDYLYQRLERKSIDISDDWKNIIDSDGLIDHFVDDLKFMAEHISLSRIYRMSDYNCMVFEGGQGLLLDRNNREYYPHLTPSNTGIENPLNIISGLNSTLDIEVCYATRTYLTRHGAGRFDGECDKEEINPYMQDLTNIPNPHQGTLRYAKLDENSLQYRILKDFEPARKYGAKLSIAVTHQNEYDHAFSNEFKKNFDYFYLSDGETRESIGRI
mgnify:CR=1 FL=1